MPRSVRLVGLPAHSHEAIRVQIECLLLPRHAHLMDCTQLAGVNMRVLLIEDNRADATLIQLAFGQVEPMIEIRWVTTAEEGLRALEIDNDAYHLVLLDLGLPRMSGAQFMAELARHGRPKKTPVMILSGTPGSQIVGVPTGDRPVG